jgi:hypothetical protein
MDLQMDVFGQEAELMPVGIDNASLLEFFRTSGATEHIKGYFPTDLITLVWLPSADKPYLVKLCHAQSLRYISACKGISKVHITI